MKPIAILFLVIISFSFNCGCDNKVRETAELKTEEIVLERLDEYQTADTAMQIDPPAPPAPKQGPASPSRMEWDKKIVKTATLQAEVNDFADFSQSLTQRVKGLGGYISQEQQNQNEFRIENAITIKVPVGQFDEATSVLLKGVKKIDTRQIGSEDVTGAYIDSKSRLEAKKQIRLRYLELLKNAKNMTDIIEVQKEINAIQEEIEMVTGRINYLGHASAMSTIQLTYYQVLKNRGSDASTPGFIRQLKDSFANGWYWLGELLIGIVAVWPLILLILLLGYLIRKKHLLSTK